MRSRSFSLVEIVLACLLLTTCAGACYYAFTEVYKERHHKEVLSRITDKLNQAYKFAQLTNAETIVIFSTNDEGKKEVALSDDFVTANPKLRLHGTAPALLEGVVDLTVVPGSVDDGKMTLHFFPWGILNPKAIIEVKFGDDKTLHQIELEKYLVQKVNEAGSENLYPQELLEDEKEKKSVRPA